VGFHGVDGSLPERKAAREALWAVSGSKAYPQVFVDNKYVGGFHDVVKMVEADEAHEEARVRMESAEAKHAMGGGVGSREDTSPGSPRRTNFWAQQGMKKAVLPRGVGFVATFNKYIGREVNIEVMSL
jgi:hypothetical protein